MKKKHMNLGIHKKIAFLEPTILDVNLINLTLLGHLDKLAFAVFVA